MRQVLERLGFLAVLRRIVRDEIDVRHPIPRVQQWSAKYRERNVEFNTLVDKGMVTVRLLVDGEVYHTVCERHTGKHRQEEAKFRAAEEGIKIIVEKFGSEGDNY